MFRVAVLALCVCVPARCSDAGEAIIASTRSRQVGAKRASACRVGATDITLFIGVVADRTRAGGSTSTWWN